MYSHYTGDGCGSHYVLYSSTFGWKLEYSVGKYMYRAELRISSLSQGRPPTAMDITTSLLLCAVFMICTTLYLRPVFRTPVPSRSAVLVTGTSSGIGRAIALGLAAAGFKRVFCGVRRAQDAPIEYMACVPVILDVTSSESILAAAEAVKKSAASDGCDLVGIVMNAGVAAMGPLETVNLDIVRHAFEVNVFGLLAVVRTFLPMLRASKGRIVLIGSEAGMISPVFYGAYAATKHAVEAIADSLRAELLPQGSSVSLLQVGAVATRIEEKMKEQLAEAVTPATTTQSSGAPFDAHASMTRRVYSMSDIGSSSEGASSVAVYEERLRAFVRLFDMTVRSGLLPPATAPVGACVHALTSPRPRARYLVGAEAWAVWAVLRSMPSHVVDAAMLLLFPSRRRKWSLFF